jgi:hypothetical protein
MSPALGLNGAFVNRSGDDKCFREKSWKECSKKSQFRAANESGSRPCADEPSRRDKGILLMPRDRARTIEAEVLSRLSSLSFCMTSAYLDRIKKQVAVCYGTMKIDLNRPRSMTRKPPGE